MKQYPKIKYPGDEETRELFDSGTVYVQEKLDGSNFRFTVDDGDLRFGSKNTEGSQLQREQFEAAIDYVESKIDLDAAMMAAELHGDLVYFGEAMNPHTISYDWESTPEFLGFDIWNADEEVFLHPEQTEDLFTDLGLSTAPIIDEIDAEEWDEDEYETPQSEFYDGLAEGVVFKNPATGTYGKYVRDEFKEKLKETFGASSKKDLSDTELLVEEYVPPARIRSVAHHILDEPPAQGERNYNTLRMEMMVDLPRSVIDDMVTEEGTALFMGESKEIDLGEFRSLVSSRCASVLRQMIDQQKREKLRNSEAEV